MNHLEKYNEIFTKALGIPAENLKTLKYQDEGWDSITHMELMAEMEDIFGIEMEADDIIAFSSYEIGKEVLGKYGIIFECA